MELGPDKESFIMARRIMKEEGLMVGGSAGQALHGAISFIKKHKIGKGKRVVVVFPDNIRNYMTKHLNPDWMYEKGYITEKECADLYTTDLVPNLDWGQNFTVGDLDLNEAQFVQDDLSCGDAIKLMKKTGFDQFPVKNKDGEIIGMLTDKNLLSRVSKQQCTLSDPIQIAVVRDFRHVSKTTTLNEIARVLFRNGFVLVEKKYFLTTADIMEAMANPKFGHKSFEGGAANQATQEASEEKGSNKWLYASSVVAAAGLGFFAWQKIQ